MNEELEFTKEQLERIDEIDNTVYDTLIILLEKDPNDFTWDIGFIHDATEALIKVCESRGYHVRVPAIETDEDGNFKYVE